MQFALDRLDELIIQELAFVHLENKDLNPVLIQQWIGQIKTEIASIRKFLWNRLLETRNKKQLRILAQQYQNSLTYLLEQVQTFKETAQEEAYKVLYSQIANLIQDTLSFIDSHFGIWLRPDPAEKGFFALFSLNEAEITALLCTFIDTHTITNHTYSSLLNFAAPIIATRQKKGLNATSMLKSKDKLTPDMKKKVKELLLQMAREIDSY